MTYSDDNIKLLLEQNSTLMEEMFDSIQQHPDVTIKATPSGFPTALYKDNYIHSRHNPYREAESLIQAQVPENVSLCIFYGMGLGYLPEIFISQFPDVPCLIIEPDLQFFKTAISARNMRSLLTHKKCHFLLNTEPEKVVLLLEKYPLSCVHIVKLRSVFEKDAEYYTHVDYVVEYFLKKREINKNTLRRFGKLWLKNMCSNIKMIAGAPGIHSLSLLFKGMPALVIAAGPSLNRILPFLEEYSERMLIIAVDTSLFICQEFGIDPDFVIIADPQYWNTRHLDYIHAGKFVCISESATHPRIFRLVKGTIFMGSSLFPLGKYIESIIGEKGKLGAGGSVATSAWDFARLIGANPIFITGLDLGFPHKNTHYKGSFFEERFHLVCSRFLPADLMSLEYLHNAGPICVESNSSGNVLSDQRMLVYKYWFETQMKLHPNVQTRNLSLNGVKIKGIPYSHFKEPLNLKKIRSQIDEKMKYIKGKAGRTNSELTLKKIKEALGNLIKELYMILNLAEKGITYTEQLKKSISTKKSGTDFIEALNKIDNELMNASSSKVVGFLIQPLINEIIDMQFKNENKDQILTYSKKMYSEIADSAVYQINIMKKTINVI
jgi:hypothetical protein